MIKVLVRVLQSDANVSTPHPRSPKPPERSLQRKQSYIFLLHGRPSVGGNQADKNRWASVPACHLNQIQSTDLHDSLLPAGVKLQKTGCPTSVSQVLRSLLTPEQDWDLFPRKGFFFFMWRRHANPVGYTYIGSDKPQSLFFSFNVYPKYTVPNPSIPAENPNPPTAYQIKSPLETQTCRLACKNRPLPAQRCSNV